MNELLLIVLIVFTLLTFLSLNKKMGSVAGNIPIPLPVMPPEALKETKVLYASQQKDYNRLWKVTSIAGGAAQSMQDAPTEMTIIYHQFCKNEISYHPGDSREELAPDVCVVSSISDFQYRHVLLPADFKI